MEESDLEQLRALIVRPLQDEVESLQSRVNELEKSLLEVEHRAGAVGEVLSQAAQHRRLENPEPDPVFSEAIRPEVELAIHQSSRTDSAVMASALYPVIGPVIRKMIAGLFSPNGETSFAIERVLLFDRHTGLPMQQHVAPGVDGEDADVISGMLDAIRSFVEDAFDQTEIDGLNDMRVGEISVLVEWGPLAGLAVVTRGIVPEDFRQRVRVQLEEIHRLHGDRLENFSGDDAELASLQPALAELGAEALPASPASRAKPIAVAVGAVLLLLALFVLAVIAVVRVFNL
jgi:OOP family OmpA-OmpF porin